MSKIAISKLIYFSFRTRSAQQRDFYYSLYAQSMDLVRKFYFYFNVAAKYYNDVCTV